MKNSIAVIGNGLVAKELHQILSEHHIRSGDFFKASRNMEDHPNGFCSIETALRGKPRYVFMAAGSEAAIEWTPKFMGAGATVIDKSDAFRRDLNVPLIVPEVNGHILTGGENIIATPNCSTIQLVMALYPLDLMYRIKRVVVATYQSISGGGKLLLDKWELEKAHIPSLTGPTYDMNVVPKCGDFEISGETTEEEKLLFESGRILGRKIPITATAVRVPTCRGHGEAVNIEFEKEFDEEQLEEILGQFPGLRVSNDMMDTLATPIGCAGKDEVIVSRIRRDRTVPSGVNLWIVADNLRKGAALNAYQIMELMMQKRNEL